MEEQGLSGADLRGSAESAQVDPIKATVTKRLMREGRWQPDIISERNRLMGHARGILGLSKEQAQEYTYTRLDEKYPPIEKPKPAPTRRRKDPGAKVSTSAEDLPPQDQREIENTEKTGQNGAENLALREGSPSTETPVEGQDNRSANNTEQPAGSGQADAETKGERGGGGVRARRARLPGSQNGRPAPGTTNRAEPTESVVVGLNRIPGHWPRLAPNSSLAAEIQWVQSVRIDVVEEIPTGGYIVHLDRAERPAPSKAALGWLETSIRAYAKYCDIAAKAAAACEDEQAVARRERMAIERCRELLGQMVADQDSRKVKSAEK